MESIAWPVPAKVNEFCRNLYGYSAQVFGPPKTCTDTVRSVLSGDYAYGTVPLHLSSKHGSPEGDGTLRRQEWYFSRVYRVG